MMNRRKQEQIDRLERRAMRDLRETDAGKLREKVPDLTSLTISIRETQPAGCMPDTQYTWRIVLEAAPALFEVPCCKQGCEDGGYDLTREILLALASHRVLFQGEQPCRGRCGATDCGRTLRYVATAAYREGRVEPGKGAHTGTSAAT